MGVPRPVDTHLVEFNAVDVASWNSTGSNEEPALVHAQGVVLERHSEMCPTSSIDRAHRVGGV